MKSTRFGIAAAIAFVTGCSGADSDGNDTVPVTDGETSTAVTSTSSSSSTSRETTSNSSASTSTAASSGSSNPTTNGSTPNETQTTEVSESPTEGQMSSTSSNTATTSSDAPSDGPASETSDSASDGDDTGGGASTEPPDEDVVDLGADDKFSFFVTSYYHLAVLSGSEDGFGGDLRYDGAATGLEGADAICQEIARRVSFGHKTWRAYLSTSSVNAIDRIGSGPWHDFIGMLVADSPSELIAGANRQPGGCCTTGTYDEMGVFHDGSTDQNNDGIDDDDHDTMTATQQDGTYAGFSCEDWTSVTATASDVGGGGGLGGGGSGGGNLVGGGGGGPSGGIMMGHSWPAGSGQHWATSHGGHNCAAGTNFIQNGPGSSETVGGGGGYGGFYCFALSE